MSRFLALAAAITLAVTGLVSAGAIGASEQDELPERARGLVFDGLRPGDANGPCAGSYEVEVERGVSCTHGPDPAPDGVDVTLPRSTAELQETSSAAAAASGLSCVGDGTSGNRVQAIYAVASDKVDRYDSLVASIGQWAVTVDDTFRNSAAETGGDRAVRWVTHPDCSLSIERVVVAPTADDSLSATISALKQAGYTRTDRKYLVWMDASVYCGIGQIFNDDRPGQDNPNNGGKALFARVDTGCWGRSSSTEAHELMHMLGGVQPSAPHATPGYHCTDESDRMCYADASGVTMTYVCASTHEAVFDCGHDDYFHTSPAPSSYLATHWNVANSSFLHGGSGQPVDPPPSPPSGLTATPGDGQVSLAWSPVADPDVTGYVVRRDGVVVAQPTGTSHVDAGLANGTVYAYTVAAVDAAGQQSSPSGAVSATPQSGSAATASFSGVLGRKMTTHNHVLAAGTGTMTAVLTPAKSSSVTLTLLDPSGNSVAKKTGSFGLSLTVPVSEGTYTWVVTGKDTSYTLSVTYPPG